ncbi:putative pilus system protein FilF [Acinetobacter oleivorans]|uniref:putative pilus system protein FilF n=1 Tax=Acinetobacter oleivorans TaxID=1148157 RepID=UPI001901B275|nr:protein FilF [Acinetobacter oleivorans]MBJ8499215.1 protein FilF [Acinetobacter oleivorans]
MNKKSFWPFALTTLAIMLNGCGGGSSNINEDPNSGGNNGNLTSGSCKPNVSGTASRDSNCFEFALDYPVEGINFDCSTALGQHFVTTLSQGTVTGTCKVGDTARFYLQGKSDKQIFLGSVKLDTIGKYTAFVNNGSQKTSLPVYLRLLDLASGITGKTPATLDKNDETIKVAIALVKIFQSIGFEKGDNLIGDIQPIEITDEKKDLLTKLSQSVTAADFQSGAYASLLKPWLDVSPISDDEAYKLVVQTTNLSNAGTYEATDILDVFLFRGCNLNSYEECEKNSSTALRDSVNSMYLVTDRQGYTFGYGLQWNGVRKDLTDPLNLVRKVKPVKMNVNAQNTWLHPISREIQSTTPLRLSLSDNPNEDIQIYQGKLFNDYAIAGNEFVYKTLTNLNTGNPQHYGRWRQTLGGENYNGGVDIYKGNKISFLESSVFKTAGNVKTGENYIFPLYANLTFNFAQTAAPPVNLGIVIDEHGDIRTDIKPNATTTDMSGQCATVTGNNLIDSLGVQQYRIGTTAATLDDPTNSDRSVYIRMMLANPKFSNIDGAMIGLTFIGPSAGTAKLNLFNLLANKVDNNSINLNNGAKGLASWYNAHAAAQASYNAIDKVIPAPTDEEKALAQRIVGTVTIKLADQSIPACKAIKTKS